MRWINKLIIKFRSVVRTVRILVNNMRHRYLLRGLSFNRHYGPKHLVLVDQFGGAKQGFTRRVGGKIKNMSAARKFGAPNIGEFSHWSWRSCGVACVASIINANVKPGTTLYNLVTKGLQQDGYEEPVGWQHQCLVSLLAEYKLSAEIERSLSMPGLIHLLKNNKYVIASVISSDGFGSHLVVVTECRWMGPQAGTTLTVWDPYTYKGKGGLRRVSYMKFAKSFLNKGISVSLPEGTL